MARGHLKPFGANAFAWWILWRCGCGPAPFDLRFKISIYQYMSLQLRVYHGNIELEDVLEQDYVHPEFLLLDEIMTAVISYSEPLSKSHKLELCTQRVTELQRGIVTPNIGEIVTLDVGDAAEKAGVLYWSRNVLVVAGERQELDSFQFHVCLSECGQKKAAKDPLRYLKALETVAPDYSFGLEYSEPPIDAVEPSKGLASTMEYEETIPIVETFQSVLAEKTVEFPVRPALRMGLKCVRPLLEKTHLIVQLDLVPTGQALVIDALELQLKNGTIEPLSDIKYPIVIGQQFSHSFSFGLETMIVAGSSIRGLLTVNVQYQVLSEDQSTLAHLRTVWKSPVDFEEASGPMPKTPSFNIFNSPSIAKRSSNISLASMCSMGDASRVTKVPLSGIFLLFEGPNEAKVGDEVTWRLMVLNRSQRTRKFSVYLQNRDSQHTAISRQEERSLVCDKHMLAKRLATYRINSGMETGIISLVNEVKLATMAPNSCYETTFKVLALHPGQHTVPSSWLVDNITNDSYDLGELLGLTVRP